MAISQYSSDGRWEGPLAADAVAVVGDLACVVLSSGYYTPGAVATGLKTIGTFATAADNTGGSAGAKRVQVNHGHPCRVFRLLNSASPDNLTKIGQTAYVNGVRTVCSTSTGRSEAGMVVGFEDETTKAVALVLIRP